MLYVRLVLCLGQMMDLYYGMSKSIINMLYVRLILCLGQMMDLYYGMSKGATTYFADSNALKVISVF